MQPPIHDSLKALGASLCVLLVCCVTACSNGPGSTDPPLPVGLDMGADLGVHEMGVDLAPERKEIARIEVEPEAATLEIGEELTIIASLFDEDDQPISENRILGWRSSDPGVATVDTRGVVRAVGPGSSTISIKGGQATASVELTVPSPPVTTLSLSPETLTLQLRSTSQITASALDASGAQVPAADIAWSTSDEDIITVTESGLITGQGIGEAFVIAKHEDLEARAAITVEDRPVARVEFLTRDVTVRVNESLAMMAVARDDKGFILEDRPTLWESSSPSRLSIDAMGVITGLGVGQSTVTVTIEDVSATTSVKIIAQPIARIELSTTGETMSVGQTLQLSATALDQFDNILPDRTFTWSHTNPSVATVDANGLVSAVGSGLGRIQVEAEGSIAEATFTVQNPVTSVEVSPQTASLIVGEQELFSARTLSSSGSDLFRAVTWSTDPANLATIDQNGLLTAQDAGQVRVIATSQEGTTGESLLTISPKPVDSVEVSPSISILFPTDTAQLTATMRSADGQLLDMRDVVWSTAQSNVATVDQVTGVVTAHNQGKATITATSEMVQGEATIVVPTTFKHVSAGVFHSCGIDALDTLYCWGRNYDNALGSAGPTAFQPRITNTPATFTSLTSLSSHTCALDATGKAYCWGSNYTGQCGNGASSGTTPSPTAVATSILFTQIDAGGSHTCGLSADGTAYCWGDNDYGQLGDGTDTDRATPSQVTGSVKFKSINAGGNHTCAIGLLDDALYCWGRNNYGQIASSNLSLEASAPTNVSAPMTTYTQVAAGASHTCTITSAGESYCVGRNFDGQLGQDTQGSDSSTWLLVSGNLVMDRIYASADHSCGLTSAGALYCWGANDVGQLGDASTLPSATPVAVANNLTFKQVEVGGRHNCAIDSQDIAYCWGSNSEGRLGNGTNIPSNIPYPVVVD